MFDMGRAWPIMPPWVYNGCVLSGVAFTWFNKLTVGECINVMVLKGVVSKRTRMEADASAEVWD